MTASPPPGRTPACPLCGRVCAEVVQRFTAAETAENFVPRSVSAEKSAQLQRIIEGLWQQDHAEIRWCAECAFGFAHPFVAGSAEFYELEAPDTPYPRSKWEYSRTVSELVRSPDRQRVVLDVGAGKGHFLKHLLDQGWPASRLLATEFSTNGRKAIEALGVRCFQSDVRGVELPSQVDVVCLFQVLEHLDDYDGLFRAVNGGTARPAELFIAVPNGARVAYNEANGLNRDYPPNHISRWSPTGFARLAANYGWTLAACEAEPALGAVGEAKYAAVERFLRNSHVEGRWERIVYRLAERPALRRHRVDRLFKAAGLLLSPDIWRVSLASAYRARNGAVPRHLWAHLQRSA